MVATRDTKQPSAHSSSNAPTPHQHLPLSNPTSAYASLTRNLAHKIYVSEATLLACCWHLSGTNPQQYETKGDPAPVAPVPAAPLRTCCGKTRQSKRPLSVLTVPCVGWDNLLSSLFIHTGNWQRQRRQHWKQHKTSAVAMAYG